MNFQKIKTGNFLLRFLVMTVGFFPVYLQATATITIVNNDSPNEGFNDATAVAPVGGNTGTTLGEQRLIVFQKAANIWAAQIDSDVEILVRANFDALLCTSNSAILGSAGPVTVHRDFNGAVRPATWYPAALANKLAAQDLNPTADDLSARFNSAIGTASCSFPNHWYLGLDASPQGNDIDLVTVVLHEMGHGLGFLSLVNIADGKKFLGADDIYMVNVEDHSKGVSFSDMTDAERLAAISDNGDIHWIGENVLASSSVLTSGADITGHVEIYAPTVPNSGSSISHFNTTLAPNELMEPFFTGARHDVGLSRPLLSDLGWGKAGVFCDIDTNKKIYSTNETVTVTKYLFANPSDKPVTLEFKAWIQTSGSAAVSYVNDGADGSLIFPPGLELDLAPFDLSAFSAGQQILGCRYLNPVTGELINEKIHKFQVQ